MQYYWTDDTPYIYDNHGEISAKDIAILKATINKPLYDHNKLDADHYYNDFTEKFVYIQNTAESNLINETALCTAVFLSYYTTPVWVPVGCQDVLKENHFLCEMSTKLNLTKRAYQHQSIACQRNHTFLAGFCWIVSASHRQGHGQGQGHRQGYNYGVKVSMFVGFLSAWSLGQRSRTHIMWYNISKQVPICLATNDFEYQHIKEWAFTHDCSTNHTLLNRKALVYRHYCSGTCVMIINNRPFRSFHEIF